ncbi:hypothetical protein EV213_12923 [Aureibacillus halotolerans]|uniref:Uncharacterized protein n=1 Tax=Aureibacillus halotolerans TaxID=1508390 RepID=A0A4R6TPG1_9BACI|nr:hypothetical protein EV213_12923 [Aureibacillus halotolerans]
MKNIYLLEIDREYVEDFVTVTLFILDKWWSG